MIIISLEKKNMDRREKAGQLICIQICCQGNISVGKAQTSRNKTASETRFSIVQEHEVKLTKYEIKIKCV